MLNDTAPAASFHSNYSTKNHHNHHHNNTTIDLYSGDMNSRNNVFDLVEECQSFYVEKGGDAFKGLGLVPDVSQRRMMKINSIGVLEKISSNALSSNYLARQIEQNYSDPFTIECQDWGACYYKFFFNNHDHANYLGKVNF